MRRLTSPLLFMSLLLAACSNDERNLTLAVSTEEPAPSIVKTIQSSLDEKGISIAVNVLANPAGIFDSVRNGSIDLGVVEEPDHPISGVATIAPLYPSVLHILYSRATKPVDFAQLLRESQVYAGPLGGAAHRLLMQLAADFGVEEDEYRLLDNPWTTSPDVYFIFGGLLSDDSVRQLSGYRLFSFASPAAIPGSSVADAIVLKHHHLKTFLLPKDIYYALSNEPVVTLSIRTVMIAHKDFSADLAFEIASYLFNNAQTFSLEYPLVNQELNVGVNVADLMFPLHSGSRRFLDRDKPGFVERYVDLIAVVLTVILALASSLFALYRRQLQIKKDRVDDFYGKLLVVRGAAETTTEHQQLQSFRKQAIAVQQEVLNLLVDERITADASLIAFLSLSNQIINELDHRIGFNV